MLLRDRLFIDGAWVAPSGRETIDVHNAGNGEVMGRVPLGDDKDVERAVAAARSALEAWSATTRRATFAIPRKDFGRPQGARR